MLEPEIKDELRDKLESKLITLVAKDKIRMMMSAAAVHGKSKGEQQAAADETAQETLSDVSQTAGEIITLIDAIVDAEDFLSANA